MSFIQSNFVEGHLPPCSFPTYILKIQATPTLPHRDSRLSLPAGSGSGPAALAEDKCETRTPVQILTVGRSDHTQDTGEPAAGGGTQSTVQDLRATMQRKGELRGVPVTPPKAQPQPHVFKFALLWRCGALAPPRP